MLFSFKQNLIEFTGKCEQCLIFTNLSSSEALNIFPSFIRHAEESPCLEFTPKIIIV